MNSNNEQFQKIKNNPIKKMVLASLFMALGIILPFFTAGPELGSIFLPMHIPILLCGLICGPKYGLTVGLITPIFRSVLFGLPPMFPIALTMTFELAAYGFFIGLFYLMFPKKIGYVYASLAIAMLLGRFVYGAAAAIFYPMAGFNFSFEIFITAAFVTGLPGILIQITFIPIFFHYLMRANILPDFEQR
ncbi:ECF transporter S component [Peloplasma aerotolerans]|jgi:predicted membrane protein|uniref:ECF transporter S component n=1 Tax=Peloplasma aerotolerans TaxID=3044389 RepID=A0AAW6U551_9MOLU|nr:ECF transporter S component [Mariniplasma sp. M4Ah]MDI6453022.1 ECF transporter S component [Mariniplasma sp. M4Ah]